MIVNFRVSERLVKMCVSRHGYPCLKKKKEKEKKGYMMHSGKIGW
jgi:hypothetical protein